MGCASGVLHEVSRAVDEQVGILRRAAALADLPADRAAMRAVADALEEHSQDASVLGYRVKETEARVQEEKKRAREEADQKRIADEEAERKLRETA